MLPLLFILSIFSLAASIIIWRKSNYKTGLLLAIIGGLLIAIHSIFVDDYLHPWDERYHAVVALNAMEDPFHLKLMPERLIDWWPYDAWYANYTWLHKQPLFTWQMALGMKIFGTSLQGMRSASVLMFLLLGIAVYRSTKLYYPKVAIWPTIFVYTSPFLLFLVNGRQGIDHNDIAFISWTAIAFWAFVSYTKKPTLKYALAIGLACGAAMLTKWLAGSLLLCTMSLYLILREDFTIRSWLHFFGASCLAMLLFLPWQIYNYTHHTTLFLQEWEYNGLHFFEVVENHEHPWYFHFKVWYKQLWALSLFFIGFVITFPINAKASNHRALTLSVLLSVVAVMIFYTLASTKLAAFTFILIPFVSFLGASFMASFRKTFISQLAMLGLLIHLGNNLYYNYYHKHESEETIERSIAIKNLGINLKNSLPENAVIFNAPSMMYPDIIFFSHRLTYERVPSIEEIERAHKNGMEVFILSPKGVEIPAEIKERATLVDASSIQFYYPDLQKTP